jgi:[glutamine synthetase] adenylyltransferase / [glutamine synthetase]-adenylyl-L-tyrosine phosphorylase
MLPPDFEELLARVGFREGETARRRLCELAADPAEMLALVAILPALGDALESSADPDHALLQFVRVVQARASHLALFHLFRDDPVILEALVHVTAASRYLADVLVRNPEYLEIVGDNNLLSTLRTKESLADELHQAVAPFATAASRLDSVRRFRRREILRIGAADLRGLVNLRQTAEQLSCLADVVIGECLQIVAAQEDRGGLVVLALGKLGGSELNYSSDIDLIFLNNRADHIATATPLARALVAALGDASGEGFLYRVDLRLRPFGSAGNLVVSADSFAEYLAQQAHPAERQAMLKARPVAGDVEEGRKFMERIRPLVLSEPSTARLRVRALKERIERQLEKNGAAEGHVKLAPGGIRDVEFLVQALQLEAGAQEPMLVTGCTQEALARLSPAGILSPADADDLREAYVFHRLVEHRLQLMDNQQVHQLPAGPDELRALARTLGVRGPGEAEKLRESYQRRVTRVRAIFERVLGQTSTESVARGGDVAIRESVQAQLGMAYDEFDAHDRAWHAELLAQISRPEHVAVRAVRESHQQWTVTVATGDRVGILSLIAGLLAASQIDIQYGDAFTLHLTESLAGPPRRSRVAGRALQTSSRTTAKVLDVFNVRTAEWVEAAFWEAFRQQLAELVALAAAGNLDSARERLMDRLSERARTARDIPTTIHPVEVHVDNDASPTSTVVQIRSTDAPGFLFEFAGALAVLGVSIQRVEIRTHHREVRDTFWVTDAHGDKLLDPDRIHELRVAAALIKQFTHILPYSPNPAQAFRQFSALAREMLSRPDWVADLQSLESDRVLLTLAELMGVSEFLWEDFLRIQHENLFPVLRDLPALDVAKSQDRLRQELAGDARQLNELKDREMFRIDLRHITRRTDIAQFSSELSDLAEVVVARACELSHLELQERFGVPLRDDCRPCPWCVCGLGKFGGREMGFASDIELLFVYEGPGSTNGPTSVPNAQYFDKCVSSFLQTLTVRREGIFEIDLRLRPYGKAGSLACSLEGFMQYFSSAGDAAQFERLALVKLRPIAGDPAVAAQLVQARDRFVYSDAALDFDNIRHLRRRQAAELVPARLISAKYSVGGLVDMEYFVQACQIEAGVNNPSVRVTNTQETIERLQAVGCLSAAMASQLSDAYRFLRELVEALRVVRGHAKDLTLPRPASREFSHLAWRLDYQSPGPLAEDIQRHMSFAASLWGTAQLAAFQQSS